MSNFNISSDIPSIFIDESTAGSFITAGLLCLPMSKVEHAALKLRALKINAGLPASAKIHCRILFNNEARIRSEFKGLNIEKIFRLLNDCILLMNNCEANWWGAHMDSSTYPSELALQVTSDNGLSEIVPFKVTKKHLTGLMFYVAIRNFEESKGEVYKLFYDKDSTKVDWGISKMQATHFARINSNVGTATEATTILLEMADIVAYANAQMLLSQTQPNNRKAKRFADLARLMNTNSALFEWKPSI